MVTPFWQLKPAIWLDTLPDETCPQDFQDLFGALRLQTTFVEAQTMRNQVEFAFIFLRETPGHKTLSIGQIATFFSIDKHRVVNDYSRERAIPKPPGRPRLFPDERFRSIPFRIL
jgi:hypothetical protein